MEELLGCEETFRQGFAGMCEAMRQICDEELYEAANFDNFEEYCLHRAGIKKSYGYQLAEAGRTMLRLENSGIAEYWLPSNEAQCRPFSRVDEAQIGNAAQIIWDTAPRVNGEPRITARHIENTLVAKRFIPPPRSKKAMTQEKIHEQNLKDFKEAIETINHSPWDAAHAIERFGKARFNREAVRKAARFLKELDAKL